MEIWNNPDCSKCAIARQTLDEAGVEYTVRAYLEQPPTTAELARLLDQLGREPWEVCRMSEPIAHDLGLAEWPRDSDSRPRWIEAMVGHPRLIQRPILVVRGQRAVVGRDPEAIAEAITAARAVG